MIIGIVGHEAAKFTPETEAKARTLIRTLIMRPGITGVCSGHCHLGGIDIWAEEEAEAIVTPYLETFFYAPKKLAWEGGFKQCNIQIAETSDECHCIVVKEYPETYNGMRFNYCYHCDTNEHIKSGGCYTVKYAMKLGKRGFWHVI